VQRLLNLTRTQVERLDTVFERDRSERVALRRKIAEMDRLLRRILLRARAEDETVKRLSEQVEALRAAQRPPHADAIGDLQTADAGAALGADATPAN